MTITRSTQIDPTYRGRSGSARRARDRLRLRRRRFDAPRDAAPASSPGSAAPVDANDATTASTATGDTIRMGLVNMDAGPFAFPEFRIGAEVAIDQINATGGINGATIEVVSCSTDLTPEASVDCANQLVEADVAVAFTAIDFASDAALPVYQEAGIPYVTTNSWGSVQSNADGSHILHLPGQGYAVGAIALAQQLGLTKIAQPYEVSPSAEDLALVQVPPIAEQMGVEIQPIAVDGAAPDWAAALATAQSSGAEMVWAQLSEPGCTAMVAAARAANFDGPVVAGECSAFIAELGAGCRRGLHAAEHAAADDQGIGTS